MKDRIYGELDFIELFNKRLKRFNFLVKSWELRQGDKVLHCHILAEGPDDIKYKLIHQYGWHIYITVLKDQASKLKWESYISKGDSLEALFINYSNCCCLFN